MVAPTWQSDDGRVTLYCAECRDAMAAMAPDSIDAVVTDPPYGLGFMGKDWDHGVPGEHFWREAMRVAKPGAHLLAFGGTRTFHRLAVAIEDAGWEIRDTIMWVYGSGFPKSHNGPWGGTALKPAWEPIIVARKPLAGTVAQNVKQYGTGGINVDVCRVGTDQMVNPPRALKEANVALGGGWRVDARPTTAIGRWPANLVHDGSQEVMARFPANSPTSAAGPIHAKASIGYGGSDAEFITMGYGDTGSAARFFYCAKASREDRNEGCKWLPKGQPPASARSEPAEGRRAALGEPRANHHPTVKPTALMRWLVRLVTPPGGLILDPFMGSGSTGKAAAMEGFRFVGCDLSAEYVTIARARIERELAQPRLPLAAPAPVATQPELLP